MKKDNTDKKLGDKILGAHNNPTKDNLYGDSFNVSTDNFILQDNYDEEEYLHKKKLEENIYEAFQKSRWYKISYKKKIPKDLIPHLFQEILENLEETEFSFVEKFVGVCDYLSVSYEKAYESIPTKYREYIVNEMEMKFQVLSKKKQGKLF